MFDQRTGASASVAAAGFGAGFGAGAGARAGAGGGAGLGQPVSATTSHGHRITTKLTQCASSLHVASFSVQLGSDA